MTGRQRALRESSPSQVDGLDSEPVTLHAGPISAQLVGCQLERVTCGGHEILRSLYVAVRDRDWDTVQPKVKVLTVEQTDKTFKVGLEVEHRSSEVDFRWNGVISGSEDGRVVFTMDGRAQVAFWRNRIGFCLLHGMGMAGRDVDVLTKNGVVSSCFPLHISPHQPFTDILGFTHRWEDGVTADIRLSGEVFEMEDQRNWTDASFKTYCTPLSLPVPVELHAGEQVEQAVSISVAANVRSATPQRKSQARSAGTTESVFVRVVGRSERTLPALGLTASHGQRSLSAEEVEWLRMLELSHLRVLADLRDPGWRTQFLAGLSEARDLDLPVELEAVCGDPTDSDKLASCLRDVDVARVLAFSGDTHVTNAPLLTAMRTALDKGDCRVPLGGGSRAYFAHFNRAELPVQLMDAAGYAISPQVHVVDTESMIESLAAQKVTALCARRLVGDTPLTIGPITLRPRFNASARPGSRRDGEESRSGDPRQPSLFAGGWLLGSIGQLGDAGVTSLTYFETVGPRGVIGPKSVPEGESVRGTAPFAGWFALSSLAELRGGRLLEVHTSHTRLPGVQVVGGVRSARGKLLLCNLSRAPKAVSLETGELRPSEVRVLRAANWAEAGWDREPTIPGRHGQKVELVLAPWEIAEVAGDWAGRE